MVCSSDCGRLQGGETIYAGAITRPLGFVDLSTQVLRGLAFIHQGLTHYYGELDCSTVLLDRRGQIKLDMSRKPRNMTAVLTGSSQHRGLYLEGETTDGVNGREDARSMAI